ncbi:sugar kinase [Saccharomonospora piscinae]|uniref:Sugar kinase n=1 Tax=Saccharomonospora piscinae TaxID=687388 RepID=A0A1V9A544_SACPI|nr:sugar kinase [Saccharomonospora piscinae]OQO92265.1 sugar kinase [Saccharomonospora piscinae]TLW92029.1 sugar kinase [Saccharomonospora piscinae]
MTGTGLVTFGEALAVFSTPAGKLRHATSVDVGIAGSEAMVAIGVARLGVPSAWAGRLGADEPGALVLTRLRDEDVDTSAVRTDRQAPTGLMIKDFRNTDVTRAAYYRNGSAGTRLSPEDVPEEHIRTAGVLHLSGLTPGLSDSATKAAFAAAEAARGDGVTVSIDIEYSHALWYPEDAADILYDLVSLCDIVFTGEDAARLLGFDGEPEDLAAAVGELGAEQVIVKRGPRGAVAELHGSRYDVPSYPVRSVDTDGADDAFVAGYLSEFLAGTSPDRRLRTAAACRAFSLTVPGETPGLPDRAALELLARPR